MCVLYVLFEILRVNYFEIYLLNLELKRVQISTYIVFFISVLVKNIFGSWYPSNFLMTSYPIPLMQKMGRNTFPHNPF